MAAVQYNDSGEIEREMRLTKFRWREEKKKKTDGDRCCNRKRQTKKNRERMEKKEIEIRKDDGYRQ